MSILSMLSSAEAKKKPDDNDRLRVEGSRFWV
jgi:hypothetical protein